MDKEEKEIYNKYKSVEARQAVDYIFGICEKCFNKGFFNKGYPKNDVKEIVEVIADDFEYLQSIKR